MWLFRIVLILSLIGLNVPSVRAQTFPFPEQKNLTPEELKILKYKMNSLKIVTQRDGWYIVRGINEEISDETLLRLVDQTDRLKSFETQALIGNGIALGGILIAAVGGVLISGILSKETSIQYGWGIGTLVAGGAIAIGGEMLAVNPDDKHNHAILRTEAEIYVKEYNEKLKHELNISNGESSIEY